MPEKNKQNKVSDEMPEEQDDYILSLWSYDPEAPKMGMRSREELEKLFYQNEFTYAKGAYQPGELCFMAAVSERLILNLMESRMKEIKAQQSAEGEVSEEQKQKLSQLEELLQVTVNRRKVVLKDLAEWVERLPAVHYYASTYTEQPYIDAKGRVFLFTEKKAVEKAAERVGSIEGAEMAALEPASLSQKLYRNGSERLVFNDGVLAFTVERKEVFGETENETGPAALKIPEENRAIRYFALGFLQLQRSSGEAEKKAAVLQQFEAQMAPRLLKAKFWFKLLGKKDAQLLFALMADKQGHQAIAAYTDLLDIPEEERASYEELSFYYVAKKVLEDGRELSGIILNPDELSFFMDQAWLKRLVGFGVYLQEQKNKDKGKDEAQKK